MSLGDAHRRTSPDSQISADRTSIAGAIRLRVAAAIDTREQLIERFAEGGLTPEQSDPALSRATVERLVDLAIAEHNALVHRASPDALRLLDALDAFTGQGLAMSFGDGSDEAGALTAVTRRAATSIHFGASVVGYIYAMDTDVETLVADGLLPLTYGVFAETGLQTDEAFEKVRIVLDGHALPMHEHDPINQRVVVGPVVFEVPYHGYGLHEIPDPDTS